MSRHSAKQNTLLSPATQSKLNGWINESSLTSAQKASLSRAVSRQGKLPELPEKIISNDFVNPFGTPKTYHSKQRLMFRPASQIKQIDIEEVVKYNRTKPTKDLSGEKKRLVMLNAACGNQQWNECLELEQYNAIGSPKTTKIPVPRTPSPEIDEFHQLMDEIRERREWLDDMIKIGQGNKYKAKIMQEIQLRISRMEQIDKLRNASFQ